MAHYLIHFGVANGESARIHDHPRETLNMMRNAANRTNGRLDGYWFIEDGSAIVAILSSPDLSSMEAFRRAVIGNHSGGELAVTRLLTLREYVQQSTHRTRAETEPQHLDRVDLGSDLSFPASDPPSWLWRYASSPGTLPE